MLFYPCIPSCAPWGRITLAFFCFWSALYISASLSSNHYALMSMGIFAAALLLVYQLILKKNPRCLPLALSVISTMKLALVVANTPYPGAFAGGIITIIVINSLAYAFAFILPKKEVTY